MPRALPPQQQHRPHGHDPREHAALYAVGLNGHDPAGRRWRGGVPPGDADRRSRVLALLGKAARLLAKPRRP